MFSSFLNDVDYETINYIKNACYELRPKCEYVEQYSSNKGTCYSPFWTGDATLYMQSGATLSNFRYTTYFAQIKWHSAFNLYTMPLNLCYFVQNMVYQLKEHFIAAMTQCPGLN